jgi:hypoxanthine phosphoribosyltransferase
VQDGVRFGRPLLTAGTIQYRVEQLAEQINNDYASMPAPLSVIVVLKGASFFGIDLLKLLTIPTRLDFLQASSYVGTGTTGEVTLHKDIALPISGTQVLLVEDIVDTGLTAAWLVRHVATHDPARIRLVSLLDKPGRRRVPVTIDYVGFSIPDEFVLGYGLDYNELYRNLPAIYVAEAP